MKKVGRTGRIRNVIPPGLAEQLGTGAGYSLGSRFVDKLLGKKKRKNPIESAKQYGLMEAVLHGHAKIHGISKKVAREMIDATSPSLRSKFARELKANPGELEEVEKLSREWHGRDNRDVVEIEEIESFSENLANLGELQELGVLGADGSEYNICFKKNRPILCVPNKKNIEIVGGDQHLDSVPNGVEKDGKRLVPLGYLVRIVYETDKHHLEGSNGYPEPYEHYFGEEFYKENFEDMDTFKTPDDWWEAVLESGLVEQAIEEEIIPILVYNQTDCKLLVIGGKYTVEDVGIRN